MSGDNDSIKSNKSKSKCETSTVIDHNNKYNTDNSCIVYKFQSRPPYEGFVLTLVIVIVIILLLWWLNTKLSNT